MTLGRRLKENPILTALDVRPSLPELEVVSVFNAAAARVGKEIILLLRVAERPRTDVAPGSDALTLDLAAPHPILVPMPAHYRKEQLVGTAVLDTRHGAPHVVVAYLPTNLPGLDLRDPIVELVRLVADERTPVPQQVLAPSDTCDFQDMEASNEINQVDWCNGDLQRDGPGS